MTHCKTRNICETVSLIDYLVLREREKKHLSFLKIFLTSKVTRKGTQFCAGSRSRVDSEGEENQRQVKTL